MMMSFQFNATMSIAVLGGAALMGFLLLRAIQNFLFPPSSQPGILTIPTEHRVPLLGAAFELSPDKYLKTMIDFPVKYGPLIEASNFFGKRILLISDPDILRELMNKRPKIFRRPIAPSAAVIGTEKGLTESNGALWARLRRGAAPFFNQSNVRLKFRAVTENVLELVDRLSHHENNNKITDMKFEADRLAVKIITATAIGMPDDHPVSEYFSKEFPHHSSKIFHYSAQRRGFALPSFLWKYSSNYKYEVEAKEPIKRWSEVCAQVIDYKRSQMRKAPEQPQSQRPALFDVLIAKQEEKSPDALSDEELMAVLKNMFLAGSDTTAATISWIPYIYVTYPDIHLTIRQEMQAFMNKTNIRELKDIVHVLDLDSTTTDFKYTNAVVKELLRVFGPISSIGFVLEQDIPSITLSNGLVVKPGDLIRTDHDAVHLLNEQAFSDAKLFKPERWLTKDEKQLKLMEENFFAFGYGPRMCPGIILATQEIVVSMICLSYAFDFRLACPNEEIYRTLNFTTWPSKMPIRVSRVAQ